MLKHYLFLFLLFFSFNARASFEFNSNCIKAYNNILSLKLNAARFLIAAEKKSNPQNAIPVLLDNYVDYFSVLINENKAEFDRLKANKSARLDRLQKEDKSSPYYLYSMAAINLQWALLRGRFEEYFTAGLEINRAYSMLQDNSKKFPNFLPNQKDLGMINILLGSMPDGLKKTLGAFGIRGNTQTGIKILENLIKELPDSPYAHFYDEAVFNLAYVQTDILSDATAYSKIIKNTDEIDTASLLRTYIRAYSGLKLSHNSEAITSLTSRPTGNAYLPYPYLEYLLGVANLHRLDKSASSHILNFLKNYKGVNFIKDAYLNLAWQALINGDQSGYNNYISLVKSKGYTYHEKDKQALKEVSYGLPDINLLKARLLFDGGYYDKALNSIAGKKTAEFRNLHDKIEYCYRLGRIYDELGKDDSAVTFYQFAIDLGKNESYYFASNAALRIGTIYEKAKKYPQAKSFYNTAIEMKNHDYESSIENKAKEGLKRVGG